MGERQAPDLQRRSPDGRRFGDGSFGGSVRSLPTAGGQSPEGEAGFVKGHGERSEPGTAFAQAVGEERDPRHPDAMLGEVVRPLAEDLPGRAVRHDPASRGQHDDPVHEVHERVYL
ncbi:MAG: hypothetical protein M3341_02505, partial [Actinomycetota bacterium]|nr:hypothetical protein [Actinomycetota bacterium]